MKILREPTARAAAGGPATLDASKFGRVSRTKKQSDACNFVGLTFLHVTHLTPQLSVYKVSPIGKTGLPVSASWMSMPVMPIIAARPLLRSAFSLNSFTAGSS